MSGPVHQLIATAAPHDAVTDQALALEGLLRRWGHDAEVLAESVHPDLAGRVRRLGGARPGDTVILRYSIWSAAVEEVLRRPPRRLALVYHNVTPPELLRASSPQVAELCRIARERLPEVAARADVCLADSAFNADDLRAAGVPDPVVVPLLLALPEAAPDGAPREPLVLTVGRVAPSKRIELLLRALALLRATGGPPAGLAVVGSWEGFERYRAALARLVADLGVEGVRFEGRVPDARRDELMTRAGVYACASAHEGFCAPLVEAMARGLPVVALEGGAVAETVGGGGLVLPGDDPAVLAEALRAVLSDPATAAGLAARARARAADFAPAGVERRLRAALAPVLEGAG